ncbi:WD40-repeat-containing domain protein [Phakopsora pachyrhizi]|nr:WD40-repeat-containing domain protein [Phakopsora pachyrhizi]
MSIDFDQETNQVISGINSSSVDIRQGKNQHLKSFTLENFKKLVVSGEQKVLDLDKEEDYQRITCLSNQLPRLLAVGGTNDQLKILNYPSYQASFDGMDFFRFDDEDLKSKNHLLSVDFDQSDSKFLVVTSQYIKVYSITKRSIQSLTKKKKNKNKKKKGKNNRNGSISNLSDSTTNFNGTDCSRTIALVQKIIPPKGIDSDLTCSFRTAKFGRGLNSNLIYAIINQLPRNPTKSKKKPSILIKYELILSISPKKFSKTDQRTNQIEKEDDETTETELRVLKSRSISQKPVTSFDLSSNGELVGIASSDLSLSILDANTLRCLSTILHAHEFPVTSLKFSPSGNRLLSCSADMTIRSIEIPARLSQLNSWNEFRGRSFMVLFILLLILLVGSMGLRLVFKII